MAREPLASVVIDLNRGPPAFEVSPERPKAAQAATV